MKKESNRLFHIMDESMRIGADGTIRNRWVVTPSRWIKKYMFKETYDPNTGEIVKTRIDYKSDSEYFIKFYDISFMRGMSARAFDLMEHILRKMDFHGMVVLDRDEYSDMTGLSPNRLYKYLKELLAIGFIYRDSKQLYFVNPNYCAKGKRHFATDYELSHSKEFYADHYVSE